MATGAIVAGTAIAGAYAASQKNKGSSGGTTTVQNQTPWQSAQLNAGFDHARALFDEYQQKDPYGGPTYAPPNDTQQQGVNRLVVNANGNGRRLENTTAQAALGLLRQDDNFTRNASQLANNGAGPANATAQNTLTRAATGALSMPTTQAGQQGLDATNGALASANGLLARSNGDPAQAALATANQYANSDAVQGQIDAAAHSAKQLYIRRYPEDVERAVRADAARYLWRMAQGLPSDGSFREMWPAIAMVANSYTDPASVI